MTRKDDSPEASEGPYWSEELLAVLVVALGDKDHVDHRKLARARTADRTSR